MRRAPRSGGEARRTAVVTRSPAGTRRLGALLGGLLAARGGGVVGLVGDLGAGKTLMAGGIFSGAGLRGEVAVTSPTFTLVNAYPGPVPMYHVDFYRLARAEDAAWAGIGDLVEEGGRGGIVVIEWFERFPELWPASFLRIDLRFVDGRRRELLVGWRGEEWEEAAGAILSTSSVASTSTLGRRRRR